MKKTKTKASAKVKASSKSKACENSCDKWCCKMMPCKHWDIVVLLGAGLLIAYAFIAVALA